MSKKRSNDSAAGSTQAHAALGTDAESLKSDAVMDNKSTAASSPSTLDEKATVARRQQAQRTNSILLAVTFLLVALVTGRAIMKASVAEDSGSLKLVALNEESVNLPEALANRDLPLADIHKDIIGSHLDKPRAYIGLYTEGQLLGEAWGEGAGLKEAIADAYNIANAKDSKQQPSHAMLVVATDRQTVSGGSLRRSFSNVHLGVRGAFIESKQGTFRLSPTQCIATNHSVEDELKAEAERRKLDYGSWIKGADIYSVDARQFFIPLSNAGKAIETLRGNRLIKPEDVTQTAVQTYEKLLTEWLFNNLSSNGRLTYLYYPSTGREARSNNMIRQWMGSVAMGRAAKIHQNEAAAALSYKNIQYNLSEFYRTEGDLGYIDFENQAKLGAAALALIAVIESPHRAEMAAYETGLLKTTKFLWRENGRFRTFLKPDSRDDENHNFYPGETLLAWSFLYAQDQDPDLLDRSMKSFAHYKEWHLNNRNPAFIPWHTQAYFQLYQKTQNEALKEWIFEMNDWLIDVMQTNSRVAYDDTIGRFYDPTSNRYGVPHASSTGVYLEGLADAYVLARTIGDKKHEEKYRKSIILGLRSGMQLQFQDEVDMFYAGKHKRLRGGMRTTVYNNEIRVDNVQHILMGVQKILRDFKPEDFKL